MQELIEQIVINPELSCPILLPIMTPCVPIEIMTQHILIEIIPPWIPLQIITRHRLMEIFASSTILQMYKQNIQISSISVLPTCYICCTSCDYFAYCLPSAFVFFNDLYSLFCSCVYCTELHICITNMYYLLYSMYSMLDTIAWCVHLFLLCL